MNFEIIEASVLKVCKVKIKELGGLADHYFLSEFDTLNYSLGWGPTGLEIRGKIRVTTLQMQRIEQFVAAARYNIQIHNCEHFANYVYYGFNFSSQENTWWKKLSAGAISCLQPAQSVRNNYQNHMRKQISDVMNQDLQKSKNDKARRERIEFWKNRGIDVK